MESAALKPRLEVRPIRQEERVAWRALMQEHHYLGFEHPIGESLCYVASRDEKLGGAAGLGIGGVEMRGARPLDWLGARAAMAAVIFPRQQCALFDLAGRARAESGLAHFSLECETAEPGLGALSRPSPPAGGNLRGQRALSRHLLSGGGLAVVGADARLRQTQSSLLASRSAQAGVGPPSGGGCGGAFAGAVPSAPHFTAGVPHDRCQCPSAGRRRRIDRLAENPRRPAQAARGAPSGGHRGGHRGVRGAVGSTEFLCHRRMGAGTDPRGAAAAGIETLDPAFGTDHSPRLARARCQSAGRAHRPLGGAAAVAARGGGGGRWQESAPQSRRPAKRLPTC